MRLGLVVVGVVLVVLGAVLLFVPVIPMQSQTVTSNSPDAFNITTIFSPTGTVQLSLSWSSSASVQFLVLTCSGINIGGSNFSSICRGLSIIGFENGTSGSYNFGAKVGSTVLAGIASRGPSSATVNVSGSSPVLATLLLVLGIVLLLAGLVLRKKAKAAPTAAPAETEAPMTNANDSTPAPT